jgi:hypothetical protein
MGGEGHSRPIFMAEQLEPELTLRPAGVIGYLIRYREVEPEAVEDFLRQQRTGDKEELLTPLEILEKYGIFLCPECAKEEYPDDYDELGKRIVYKLEVGFPFKIEGIDNDGEVVYYSEDFPQCNRCGKILKGARFFDKEGKELVIDGINEKTGRVEVTKKGRKEEPEGGSTRKTDTEIDTRTVEEDDVTRKMEKLLKAIDDLLRRLQG